MSILTLSVHFCRPCVALWSEIQLYRRLSIETSTFNDPYWVVLKLRHDCASKFAGIVPSDVLFCDVTAIPYMFPDLKAWKCHDMKALKLLILKSPNSVNLHQLLTDLAPKLLLVMLRMCHLLILECHFFRHIAILNSVRLALIRTKLTIRFQWQVLSWCYKLILSDDGVRS